MVLQGLDNLDEHTASKYPGIGNYATCQSRAFVQGLLGMVVGGGTGLLSTFAAQQFFPSLPSRYNVFYVTGVAVLAGYLVTARASRKCQKTLVQSQLNKNRVDQENLILDSGESVAKSTVVEVISEVQESTPTADQLISESGNINWKSTKYGDVMG
ncbi:putative transmembrane protein [Apostichopus japonicus]|uniref:Putative transmembrane protein n=1 Tax=Stichopus japonicus TaxID=307972 RepID=A0A2G8K514_STIJA|nr:putative transmembrane protein [Apostichopus japonicus]